MGNINNVKHNMYKTKFYKCWQSIKCRCNNKNYSGYKYYGGRGITYNFEWRNFISFYNDMYFKYLYAKKQLGIKEPTIEREDVNGNYDFENCIFISKLDQNKNQQKNKIFKAVSPEGKVYFSNNQNEFARKNNVAPQNLNGCLKKRYRQHKGWIFNYVG